NDPVNSPPTLTADVTEDLITVTSGNVLDAVTDADSGDTHTVTAVNGLVGNVGTSVAGTYGTLTIDAAGNAQYTLNNGLSAVQQLNTSSPALIDSFNYTVGDGHGSFATTTLNVSVHGRNDAPVANFDFATIAEDTAGPAGFNVLTNDSDVDAADTKTVSTFTFAGVTHNAGDAVTLGNGLSVNVASNGDVSFTQSGVFNGLNTGQSSTQLINYTMVDSAGAQSSATAQILVTGVNDAPVANPNTITVIEDTPTAINVLGNDTDVDGPGPLTLDSITGTSGTTTIVAGNSYTIAVSGGSLFVSTAGALTFTPTADVSGPGAGSFSYVAKDGNGALSGSAAVTINVTPVNDAPNPTQDAFIVNENGAASVGNVITGNNGSGIDSDVETPLANLTVNGIRIPGSGGFTNVPNGGSATLTFANGAQVTVDSSGNVTLAQNGAFESLGAGQQDELTIQYRLLDTGDPAGSGSGSGAPTTANANVRIVINGQNDAPVAAADTSYTTAEDTPLVLAVLGNDTDVDGPSPLAVARINGTPVLVGNDITVTGGSVHVNADGTLTFTPTLNSTVDGAFTYTAKDGSGTESVAVNVAIDVTPVNDAPQTNFDSFTVAENGPANVGNVLANDTDVDGPNLQVTSFTVIVGGTGTFSVGSTATLASGATLSVAANGDVTLTQGTSYDYLGNGETAQVLFSYQVSDNGSPAMTAGDAAQIVINGVNEAPTLSLGSPLAALETASSSPVGIAVASATAAVTDEESKIKTIEVDISSGYQDGTGSTGERAQLSALGDFALSLFGGSASFVDNGNHGTLTVSFPTPITASQATQVLKQIDYVDQIGDFTLAIALDDTRTISVRVQDHDNVWSNTVTHDVNIAADVLDGSGNGTFVGGRFNDTINGADGNDTLTGGKGDDSLIGGNNSAAGDTVNYAKETDGAQVSETGTHGVAVNLSGTSYDLDSADSIYDPSHLTNDPAVAGGHAIDTYGNADTLSGIENVVGTKYDDLIVDEKTISNSYSAGEGTLANPEVAGDTVAFNGTLGPSTPGTPYFRVLATGVDGDDFTVQYFDPNLGPSGTVLATDTLTDVENMIFDNGTATSILNAENPVWVIEDGYLIGTFTTVAAAVAKANLAGGTTVVEIGHGTAPPADYDEGAINVTRAMTIKGIGAQQIIHATDSVDLFVVSGSATGLVRFENLALSDNGVGPTADYGIRFAGTYGVNASTNLQVSGVSVSGFEQTGFLVNGGGTSVNVAVDHATFSGNGGNANSGGSGDILFFEYTGAASLDHVTVTGTTSGSAATTADYGIQFAGFHDSDDAIENAIGNVSFSDVSVTGHYDNALVYVQGYNNLSGLSFATTTIGNAASTAGWTGLYVEPKSTGGPFTPSGGTSTLDLTNVTLAGTYGWQTTFQLPGADLILGVPTNDHIIGSGSNDAIRTLTGTDSIEAGGGNDLIIYDTLPGAKHTVDGGLGTDTEVVFGTAGAETFNVNAISGTQLGINILAGTTPASTVAATLANYEVATTAVEEINIQTGNGGDNVVINGDLQGTGVSTSTITVVGGTGNDTVDASGMLNAVDTGPGDVSRVGVDFTGGAGNDTFISNSIGSNDRFDGGTNTTGDTVNYGSLTGGGVSVHLGNQSATDIGGTGVGSDTLIGVENAIGSGQHDVLVGSSVANTLSGGGGDDSLAGNAGADSLVRGLGTDTADYSLESGTNGVTVDLGANTATDTFGNTDTLTSIENATGTSLADTLTGGTGANVLTGLGGNDTLTGTGNDTLIGGANDDIYYAHMSDDVQESNGQGTDEVRATESYTLDANVENLTLLDNGVSDTQDFASFGLGPITDGENGWHVGGPNAARDQEVVSVSGNKMFRMSSDPGVPDFAGPFSPSLGATAGESTTSADFNAHSVKFVFKPVDPTPDGSRLEVDFGNAAGTDRNNFMVLESVNGGIRIAVAQPNNVDGDFDNPGTYPNDWRELVANVDPTVSHTLEMRLQYVDGPDNDLINIYLDSQYIGSTTTFENYRDLAAPAFPLATHADNAEANQTNRVFFRPSANGAPQDGNGPQNKGFYFENVSSDVHNNIDGTGNDLANIITGNAGDNTLAGKGANDQLFGGAGIDTAKYDDAYSNYAVTYTTDAHGFVTGASQVQETGPAGLVAEGTDTLSSIERLAFSNVTLDLTKRVQLFDGANKLIGTFDHIQDAVNAGADGDTIRLAAGTFTESVTVDRNIAILGANSGDPGTGSRSAESIVAGQVSVTAAHSATQKVTVDGVEIFNTSSNSASFTGIQVNSGADIAIKNSVFFSAVPNASNTTPDRAILLTTGATGTIAIDHNLFTGGPSAHNLFSTAAWTTAIWSDGSQTAATIAFNTFEWVRTAINADDFDSSFNVVNNTFQNSGSGISIGGVAGGANVDVASITSIHDNTFSNVDTDFNLQNITAAGKQIGLDLTATNNHAVNTATDFVTVLAGANADTVKGSVGVDALIGNGGNDSLDGGAGNDGMAGSGADDTLHGGAGDDALFGGALLGADSGKDKATYDDARANYTLVTTSGVNAIVTSFTDVTETTVTGTNEGHDTLSGIEVLQFAGGVTLDLTQNVQLFNSSGDLIGTFDTIQAAVDAAVDSNTVRLKALTYNENVTIHGKAITIDGVDDTLAGSVITGQITVDTTLDGLLTIKDVLIDATGHQYGVFASANSTGFAGGITINNVTIENAEQDGFAYVRAGNGTTPTLGDTLGAISFLNSAFSNNATTNTGSGGRGDILLYGYNQDLTITDVVIGSPGAFAQKAIQVRGIEGGDTVNVGPYDPAGDVAINNLTITGGYGQDVIAFYRLASFASFTGANNNVNVTRSVNANPNAGLEPWAVINFDEVGGTIDLSGFFASASNLASPDGIVPAVPSVIATPQGLATGDTFTGTSGMDVLVGRGGNDILNGGGGDDLFLYAVGDGNDTVDGGTEGANGDLLAVSNAGGAQATITLDAIGAGDTDPITIDISTTAGTEITASEIEDISITLGVNGDTVVINGGLGGTSLDVNTITVTGGVGGDTVDATGLTSGHRVVFNGGSGADTFKSSGVDNAGVDEFNGGADSDTVDYSAVTSGGVTIDLGNAGIQDTVSAGSDKLTSVENVIGTGFADMITGNGSANMLIGGDGPDTFTGGAGNDTIYGGSSTSDTSTSDKAIFGGSSSGYTISFDPFAAGGADGIDVTVTGGADGDDTLHGVELLQFGNGIIDLTKGVLLFDSGNHLIGAFDHIQDAVNAADGSGDTIKVRNGLYVEQVTIDATKDGLKIVGESEAGVIVQAPNVLVSNGIAPSNGRNVDGVIVVDGADSVQIKTLTVDGALKGGVVVGASDPTMVGVGYLNATGGLIDHVTVTHVREPDAGFGNQRNLGIFISNSNPSAAAPRTPSAVEATALDTIEISHTTVTDFQKGGIVVSFANASIHDNTVTGHGLTGLTAQNGIQLAGSTGSVNGNTVTAVGYNNPAVAYSFAILTFNNRDLVIDGNHLTGTGPTDGSAGIAAIGSVGAVVTNNDIHNAIDAIDVYADASFSPDPLTPSVTLSNPTGAFDYSSNTVDSNVTNSVYFDPFAASTDVFNVTGTNRHDELHGGSAGDTLNGGAGADILEGRGGADIVNGGAGNDTITWNAGDGNDTIDGGNNGAPHSDLDTLQVASPGNDLTLTAGVSSFSIADGSNTATVSEVEEVAITLGGGHNVTLVGDFAGTGIAVNTIAIDGHTGTSGETVDASGMVHSSAASDIHIVFTGGSGNDTFKSGTGNDTFHGGAGNDVASFHGNAANATITWNGTTASVTTAADGVDTIDGTGRLDFQDHHVFLVGSGSDYTTIQSAINAASAGDTIIVDDGTYNENLTVDKGLTILGANRGVAGTGSRSDETVLNWTSGNAVNVTTTAQATFDGFKFTGTHVLTETNPDANIAFTDSVFTITAAGNNSNNFYLNQPDSFTFTNNKVDVTGYTGAFFQPVGTPGHPEFTTVTITGNTFTGTPGAYVPGDDNDVPLIANLSDVHGAVTGNTFNNIDIGVLVANGTGPLDISGNTFEHMHRDGPALNNGFAAGVVFFTPAPFTNTINIHDNHFTDMDAGVRTSGVPGSTVVGSNIVIDDNDFTAVANVGFQPVGGVLHFTNSTVDGPSVPSEFFGGADDDSITATPAVNDIVHGNTGIDTVVFTGNVAAATMTWNGTTASVTTAGGGTDTLDGVGVLQFADHKVFLVAAGNDYATIQSAIAAASNGDTILVAAGTYTENLEVGKQLTILGANHGVAGNGARGAETVVNGGFHLTSGDVTIDGVEILNGRVDYGFQRTGVFIEGALANVTVENSIIDQTVTVHSESDQFGIVATYNADTPGLQVLSNVIQNWDAGMYLNPGVHDSTFSGNVFTDNGNHLISDGVDDLTITNNNFGASGGSKIFVNVYANPTDLEAELGLSGNTFAPDHARLSAAPYGPNGQVVLGTSGDDNLRDDFGIALNVTLDGRGGNDLLAGGTGNDTLNGGAGSDTVSGGTGNDRIVGTLDGVADTYNGDGNDAVNAVTGAGGDTIDYSATTNGISVTLAGGGATVIDDQAGTDTLGGIENVTGGSGDDIITGDNNANILIGSGGVDSLTGSGGADRLVGGAGADNLSGGIGADIFVYEQRSDGGNAISGQDLISGFSVGEADKFAFDDGFFNGVALPGDFNDSGHVNASYFLVTNVSGTSYAGGASQAIFVLDDVSPGFAGTLWFDAEGDGQLNGVNDVKIADMSNASVLTGFNQDHLLLI
ncbi:MAG: hypothetical protein QOH67_4998, partial [Hyphomicrobiales bacterium]|nr:hypothetical protein [Hyphomicrobiales bacterium]